jgi:transcriptional regulator with XRE-family HTH domain
MLLLMKGDELNKRLKKLVEKYKENLKEYIFDLYYEEKYEDLRSEIEIVRSLKADSDMKLKEINKENVKLSSHVESEVGEKDLKDIARELEKIVENRKDLETFEYLLRRHYVKSNMSQVKLANEANVEYTTLNKILNNRRDVDSISKDYIIKLCLGLNLNIRESQELLMSAGYVLLGINERELFIRAAIQEGLSITDTNLVLDINNMKLL